MAEICAVLTGDLIRSTKVSPDTVEAAFSALLETSKAFKTWPAGGVPAERHRGDGWQALVYDPRYALRAALVCCAAVGSVGRDAATRVAVGVGPVSRLHSDGLGSSDGAAFRSSGRLLEAMARQLRVALIEESPAGGVPSAWREASFELAGALAAGWTRRQSEVMVLALSKPAPTQSEIGHRLGITQQTAQEHFEAAHGGALLEILDRVEGQPFYRDITL